jgi:glycerol kinase
VLETTALGAAYLAGLATGYWKNADDLRANWQVDRSFEPEAPRERIADMRAAWDKAVERAKAWAS